ncbi:Os07g0275801, partial [Oryza sativa Japonica Group]
RRQPVVHSGSTLTHDGYSFLYPNSWIQVRGAGADLFRDPFVLDENMSVEISSPSSSKYVTVEDLGPPPMRRLQRECCNIT